jgi:hypothetical protein
MSDDEDIPIPVTAEEWRDAYWRHVPMYQAENAELRKHLAELYAREWGAPEHSGPGEYRWPPPDAEKP